MSPLLLFIAFLGGILPACIWLFFWLLEDRCQPEPKRYILLCFVLGGLAVWPALKLEEVAIPYFSGIALLFCWAITEEVLKFAAAYFAALRWRVFDEPLDAVIYLVTAALGFSAVENMLFLFGPLEQHDVMRSVLVGDLRFMGATLLHTLASASVGITLALSYYKPAWMRRTAALLGVILAIALHTLFNFFILGKGGGATFWIFLCIWCGIVAVLLLTERIKQPSKNYC
ncbi:MAG: PrsW family glutamic-type intramembrane protease [bacterium]|nr:PrsW family glutamic-type intramembrane protease [bacterium]